MVSKLHFIWLLIFCLTVHLAKAQEKDLRSAPEADVKKITEWITLLDHKGKVKSTHRRMSYHYRTDGQADSIIGSNFQKHLSHCQYYKNGKRSKVYSYSAHDSIFIRYTYHNDREIQDIHLLGRNRVNRKVNYYNANNQITEAKEFEKSNATGNQFRLIYRTLYNYNDRDSLFAEQHYHYMLYNGSQPSSKSKVVHEYHPTLGHRLRSSTYDFEEQPVEEINYRYTPDGLLSKQEWSYSNQAIGKERSLLYKNGQLWQDRFSDGYRQTIKVYKDGRYIRKKVLDMEGNMAYYIDFQYEFY
ncbi:MAG: hypothetical protein AAFO94_08040 [Bacteroidota bacterium]